MEKRIIKVGFTEVEAIGTFKSNASYYRHDSLVAVAVSNDENLTNINRLNYEVLNFDLFKIIKIKYIPKADLKEYVEWCRSLETAVYTNASKKTK